MQYILMAVVAAVLSFSALGAAYGQTDTAQCGAGEYLYNNQCVASCPAGWAEVATTGQDQCVFECADNKHVALVATENSDKVEYHCLDDCDIYSLEPGVGTDMCQGYGEFKIYEFEGRDIHALHTVKSGCPDALPLWDGMTCGIECPANMPVSSDGVCVAACPAGTLVTPDSKCVRSCPADAPYTHENTCLAACPADAPNRDNDQCLASCPTEKSEAINGLCTKPAPALGTDSLCYFQPGHGYATPEQQGVTLSRDSGTIYVGAGMYGTADASLLGGAVMGEDTMSITLNDDAGKYDQYVINICDMHTGDWGSISKIDSAAEPLIFDKYGSAQHQTDSNVRYLSALSYDPANTYWIYAVGMSYDDAGKVGDRVWLSPYQVVSFAKSFEYVSDPGDEATPQQQQQQYAPSQQGPTLQYEPGTSGQDEPPQTPSKSESKSSDSGSTGPSGDAGASGSEQEPALSPNEEEILDLLERIDRLDYRIEVAQDLLDRTEPHQEKRIEKLNALIDKLTERKAVLQERLDGLL